MTPRFGLCDHCVHQRKVGTTRGSTFSMCLRHRTDPAFPKYPPMPVVRCRGYERPDPSADPAPAVDA